MKRRRHGFFFSSRRRHTRFDCDWSSDVCSSDLGDLRDVGDDQRPLGGFKFAEKELGGGYNVDAPAFGVENLAKSVATRGVAVEHEDTDGTPRNRLGGGSHFRSIAPGNAGQGAERE